MRTIEEKRALAAGLRHLRAEFARIAEGHGDDAIGRDAALRKSDVTLLDEVIDALTEVPPKPTPPPLRTWREGDIPKPDAR